MKRLLIVIFASLYTCIETPFAGTIRVHQDLNVLCTECSASSRMMIQQTFGQVLSRMSNQGEIQSVATASADYASTLAEQVLLDRYLTVISKTNFGTKLLTPFYGEGALGTTPLPHIRFRLFHQIALRNGDVWGHPGEPLWVTEKKHIHELFSFFVSNGEGATIALNNYQPQEGGVYSLVHELFHLKDQYLANLLSRNTKLTALERIFVEYRALLAELNLYLELIRRLISVSILSIS